MAAKKETAKAETVVEAPVVEEKAAAKKTTTRKTAAKKTETAEKTVKEEAPKKAPAKRTTKKAAEPEVAVTVQFQGKEIVTAQVVEAAKKAFAEENPDVVIKTMAVYVKPEENAAYYVVNEDGTGKVEL